MAKQVNLLLYLPPYMREYQEMNLLELAENAEVQKAWNETDRLRKNSFILYADEAGIKRFEKILGITAGQDESLETRRNRVLAAWNENAPYTFKFLLYKLEQLFGDRVTATLDAGKYRLIFNANLNAPGETDTLDQLITDMVPCHLLTVSENQFVYRANAEVYLANAAVTATTCLVATDFTDTYKIMGNIRTASTTGISTIYITNQN